MSLTRIPLINIGPEGINKDECNDLEKQLLHIPDVRSLNSMKHFSWAYRKLVAFTKNDACHGPLNGDYMMYLCLDERSELPHNDYLEELVELGRGPLIPTVPFKVYGDAFVFRMESKSKNVDERQPAYMFIWTMASLIVRRLGNRLGLGHSAYCACCCYAPIKEHEGAHN